MLQKLNSIKLGPKLIGAFVSVALIALVIGLVGYAGINAVDHQADQLGEVRLPSVDYLWEIDACMQAIWVGERGLTHPRMMDPELRQEQYDWIDEHRTKAEAAYEAFIPLEHSEQDAKLWGEFEPLWAGWIEKHEVVYHLSGEKDRLIASGVPPTDPRVVSLDDQAFAASLEAQAAAIEASDALDGLLELQREEGTAAVATSVAVTAQRQLIMLVASGIGLVLAVLLGVAISRNISDPMRRTVRMIDEMGRGHLNERLDLKRGDEIGELAGTMDRFAEDLQQQVIGSMQRIAEGDANFEVPVKDGADEIGPALNETAGAIQALVSDANMLSEAAVAGKLDVRADAERHQGDFRRIIEGVNDTLDAVVEPLQEANEILEGAANRDLTSRMKGDYRGELAELKNYVNRALNAMDESLGQVAGAVVQVAEASGQISSGSQQLAEGAAEQASSLEEVSSSLEELGAMTRQNAGNAGEARNLSDEAAEGAKKGNEAMTRMSDAMDQIQASSEETAKIVKTIDEIAFQTNLLALNAAVEAARAGDAGKGFAVVAEEVRNLAQRSAEAAKDTADMIEEAVKNAEGGVTISHEVAEALTEIGRGATSVNELVAEIAAASDEQAQGLEQINTAIGEMDSVTQNNAANSEESASAAEELSAQAQELRGMVETFRLTVAQSASGGTSLTLVGRDPGEEARRPTPAPKEPPSRAIPLDDDDDMEALSSF
ncbi:MAG: HAMP domain-containing methyl-accepting chemotaxis protein [Armatimonadota bacterium]|jgi:methyl-accepting chemotaxis protein